MITKARRLFLVLSIFVLSFAVIAAVPSNSTYALNCTVTVSSGSSIQSAINSASPGSVICVGPGTFPEQLVIDKQIPLVGSGSATIIRPTSITGDAIHPVNNVPEAPIILVNRTSGVVVEDLVVDGSGVSFAGMGCGPPLYMGVLFDSASGTLQQATIENINLGTSTLYGCQNGLAVFVQSSSGHNSVVTISSNTVTNYQKNGITCNFAGSDCNISGNTVSPLSAAQPYIASNGIQIAFGAEGSVTDNTVSGNECTLATYCSNDLINAAQGTGILLYQAGSSGVSITGNTLSANDIGIGMYLDPSGTVTTTGNTLQSNKYYGVVVYDENETVSGNTLSSTPVGLGVVSDTSGLTAILTYTDSFSNVDTNCQAYTANGGVAICKVQQAVTGVPEFGAPAALVTALSFLLVVYLRQRLTVGRPKRF